MNWSSFVFVHKLKSQLRDGIVVRVNTSHYCITGILDAPAVLARLDIRVPQNFDRVLEIPPMVFCREPWMRTGVEWHNDSRTGMCWVLEAEWRDVWGAVGRSERESAEAAARWLINNVTSLISRHHYASLEGLKRWPKEWEAWGHYDAGIEEYERSKQSK
jgi:hypothetical protein